MDKFIISVIIPVYNAAEFLTQAVESAIQQPEVSEVLLIEDGSQDGGLAICENLENIYQQVRLLRHPDGRNHGASASRNLGLSHAVFPFIAFLDADDYYLPNRFSITRQVFESNSKADGVYEAIGTHFQSQEDQENYLKTELPLLTTVNEATLPPQLLFIRLMKGDIGHFSIDGFTVKTNILRKVGYFNERLEVHQDTDFLYKLSAFGQLYPGNISEPVAVRRVHSNNRITSHLTNKRKSYEAGIKLWQSMFDWGENELNRSEFRWVVRRMFAQLSKIDTCENLMFVDFITAREKMFRIALKHKWIFLDLYCWKRIVPSRSLFAKIING